MRLWRLIRRRGSPRSLLNFVKRALRAAHPSLLTLAAPSISNVSLERI